VTSDEFWSILRAMPEPRPIFWRLYHDDQGRPITYSMEHLPGAYIDIDPETFILASLDVRVQNGQLIKLKQAVYKLAHSDSGTPCHPSNVAIVVSESQPHQCWSMKTHEFN